MDGSAVSAENISEDTVASIRLILRWLQHEGKLPHDDPEVLKIGKDKKSSKKKANDEESETSKEEKITLDLLGAKLGLTTNQLNKFLGSNLNRNEEKLRAAELLAPLSDLMAIQRSVPKPVTGLMESVFGVAIDKNSLAIPEPHVWNGESMARVTLDRMGLVEPFYGLSCLIRPANESVTNDEGVLELGWSISMLNVLPPFVQEGTHHPLFKLRQRGLNRNYIDIHGVVVAQEDRFLLEGIERQRSAGFSATMFFTEDEWLDFRHDDPAKRTFGAGIMMGLSSGRVPFCGPFELAAVPGSVLTEGAQESEIEAFQATYDKVRDMSGVRNLANTIGKLAEIGIVIGEGLLLDMRERMREGRVLTLT